MNDHCVVDAGPHRKTGSSDIKFTLNPRNRIGSTASYFLMLEDDVLAMDGWYRRTKNALRDMEAQPEFHQSTYLRLFYDQGLQGWNSEYWPYYVFWSVIWELCLIGVLYVLRRKSIQASKFLTPNTVLVILFGCSPLCIAFFFAAGRATVYPNPHGIHKMNHHGCCSQAFVFPREQVPPLLAFFREKVVGYRDSLTEEYSDQRGMTRWALSPSAFQHVGSQTSKADGVAVEETDANGRTVAQNIWSFDFEAWDAETLRGEHVQ